MKYKYDSCRDEVDVGCKYADNCFNCPFDDCIMPDDEVDDDVTEYMEKRQMVIERVSRIKGLWDDGMSIRGIAKMLKISEKKVSSDLNIAVTLLGGNDVKQD